MYLLIKKIASECKSVFFIGLCNPHWIEVEPVAVLPLDKKVIVSTMIEEHARACHKQL